MPRLQACTAQSQESFSEIQRASGIFPASSPGIQERMPEFIGSTAEIIALT
jgi:hypothetical protein